jgi:hypothetical protein
MLFGPFWPPYTGQIHAQSVANTLFGQSQKENSAKLNFRFTEFSEVRLKLSITVGFVVAILVVVNRRHYLPVAYHPHRSS